MHKYRLISKKGEGTFSEVLKAQVRALVLPKHCDARLVSPLSGHCRSAARDD
jgi:hypothetical protein